MSAPGASPSDLPETVPARMVNEFVYCPRLFHLEWVQSRFATNDDVEQGLYVHRVVDEPGGSIPDPDDLHPELLAGRTSRSVWLTSAQLKVSAKIDLVEVSDDGSVVPVDYKKGSPDRNGRPWPSDEVQSVLQALVLRDAGYSVSTAEIWYDKTRQRVVIPIHDAVVNSTRETVAQLWKVAASDSAPPPLVDSPKCPRCSLVGICLPDEVNALRQRETDGLRKRRIIPSNPDPHPIYIQEQGSVVTVRGGRLEVFKERDRLDSLRLIDVGQVCLQGNVNVTPQAMRELMSREIPVCWFSYGGWFSGMTQGLPGKNVDLRRAQFTISSERALAIAQKMVEGKIRNSRTLLRRNSRTDVANPVESMGRIAGQASAAGGFPTLLGLEGAAARIYFANFSQMLTTETGIPVGEFDSNGRSRRPPPDPVNTLLSFAYALLVKDVTTTLAVIGFDPYFGVYHRPRFGRPALALDLAEEFRPLIADSLVLQVINNGEVSDHDFLSRAGGCQLQKLGRRAVIHAYERRLSQEIKHPLFGYRVSYRRAIDVQARLLAAHLLGEVAEYTPFVTR